MLLDKIKTGHNYKLQLLLSVNISFLYDLLKIGINAYEYQEWQYLEDYAKQAEIVYYK